VQSTIVRGTLEPAAAVALVAYFVIVKAAASRRTPYQLRLAGGTTLFMRKYSTIWP
jgi:hypothetical protein